VTLTRLSFGGKVAEGSWTGYVVVKDCGGFMIRGVDGRSGCLLVYTTGGCPIDSIYPLTLLSDVKIIASLPTNR
jgi:hypothetical protein